MAKRKIENRLFHESWETDYFFVNYNGQPQCLLCRKKLADMKKCNVARHYDTYHKRTYDTCSAECRVEIVKKLKQECQIEDEAESEDSNLNTLQQRSVAASYAVALEIGRAKRSFSDGELIKKCAIEMAKAFGNKNAIECFQTVSLSRNTISNRFNDIDSHIENKLKMLLQESRYFSLCLDESTDITDVNQLLIFVRMINKDFSIYEELLSVVPLHSTTKGVDIFNAVCEQVEKYGGFSKCSAIVTDGAKAMVGHEIGLWGLLKKNKVTCQAFQCIIHQEALCGKILMLTSTMKVVTKVVNLIRGGNKALSHRKFKTCLEDMNATYGDLCLYSEIRWLSAGECLKRFFNLRKEMSEFLKNEIKADTTDIQEKLIDTKFLSELAFLTDMTHHLNHLNTKLQIQNQIISDLIGHVNGFQNQLQLFIGELAESELYHFPCCQEISNEYPDADFSEFQSPLLEMQQQFQTRFKDFELLKTDLQIFNNPKGCTIREQEGVYRIELCNLQADPFALSRNENGIEFFKLLSPEKYPKIIDLSLKICSMFASTYKCESTFSIMRYIKSKYRASITDKSLNSLLGIATSNISVDIPTLVSGMTRPQISH